MSTLVDQDYSQVLTKQTQTDKIEPFKFNASIVALRDKFRENNKALE